MCFVFIWEQTATCATYSINWLLFITEIKNVYCAVRTGSLNKAVCVLSLKGLIGCGNRIEVQQMQFNSLCVALLYLLCCLQHVLAIFSVISLGTRIQPLPDCRNGCVQRNFVRTECCISRNFPEFNSFFLSDGQKKWQQRAWKCTVKRWRHLPLLNVVYNITI